MDEATTQAQGKMADLQRQARATVPAATIAPTEGLPSPQEEQPPTAAKRPKRTPPPTVPAPSGGPPVQVVEPTPIIKAIERLHQTVGDEMATVTRFTQVQGEYLTELKRAQNALTSEGYKVAAQVPQVEGAMQQLAQEIRLRQREMEQSAKLVQRVAAVAVAVMVLAVVLTVAVQIVIARRHL